MASEDDEILAHELSKIGLASGGTGGGIGARIAARFLGNDTFEISKTINESMPSILSTVTTIFQQEGRIVENIESTSNQPAVYVFVGSGYMNMNPALVSVTVQDSSEHSTTLLIKGVAKEGLIKQHSGRKAAQRIAELLDHTFQK